MDTCNLAHLRIDARTELAYCCAEGSMRYLFLALLAGTAASGSIITSSPDLDFTVDVQNPQNVDVYIGIGGISVMLRADQGESASMRATLTSYVTVTGATGTGSMIVDPNYQDCYSSPGMAGGCVPQLQMPFTNAFTFGVPLRMFQTLSAFVDGPGYVSGGISRPHFFNVTDSLGNPVDATFAFSATVDSVAEVHNPEPATWGLLVIGFVAMAARRRTYARSASRPARTSTRAVQQQ